MLEIPGLTEMETSFAPPTTSTVLAEVVPMVAIIVVEPTPELVARPCEPVLLLITATMAEELDQFALVVTSFVLWSV